MSDPNPTPKAPAGEGERVQEVVAKGRSVALYVRRRVPRYADAIDEALDLITSLEAERDEARELAETLGDGIVVALDERDALEEVVKALREGLAFVREELVLISSTITSRETYGAADDDELAPVEQMIIRIDALNQGSGVPSCPA
jgi:uncharacterized coiled-coil DUF342 family protein